MRLYGGGPAIHVDGPPVEDLTRYVPYNLVPCVFYLPLIIVARLLILVVSKPCPSGKTIPRMSRVALSFCVGVTHRTIHDTA